MKLSKLLSTFATIASITVAHAMSIQRQMPGPSVASTGYVTIINNLNTVVYSWSVSDTVDDLHILAPGGGTYTEAWRINGNGGGIAIKLSTRPDQSEVLQFEYTKGSDDTTIFWDMSLIDIPPTSEFTKRGFSVTPAPVEGALYCPTVYCAPGNKACAQAYLKFDDDHATHGCHIDTPFTLRLG